MTSHITVIGTVATQPRSFQFDNGDSKCVFRVAESPRRLDRQTGQWENGVTSWYTVNASNLLGKHSYASLQKGDRIVVTGKLRVRDWVSANGKSGTNAEIDATGLGHDLRFGVSTFVKETPATHSNGESTTTAAAAAGDYDLEQVEVSVSEAGWGKPSTKKQLQPV